MEIINTIAGFIVLVIGGFLLLYGIIYTISLAWHDAIKTKPINIYIHDFEKLN